jgi:hypothetical protein
MVLKAYERDIPDAPNNPSVDQPDMKANTNAIDDILAVDHYSFNVNESGWHKQATMPVLGAIPAKTAGQGVTYTKTADGASNLFYAGDANTDEYQLTRTNTANFPTFAVDTGPSSTGWTFLPGGLLMQWGHRTTGSNGTASITFPITFTTGAFTVLVTVKQPGSVGSFNDRIGTFRDLTTSGFTMVITNGSGSGRDETGYWIVVGK